MRTLAVLIAILFSACGPGAMRGDDDGNGSGSGSGSGSNTDGCSDAAKLVYTVDANNTLAKFDPATKTFMNIGTLSCPGEGGLLGGSPFSMGIDRDAVAWVLFSDGKLFDVDTSNAACTATNWTTQQNELLFGMGFSANTAGSTEDTLFIAGGPGDPATATTTTLAKLNTTTMTASTVGTVTGVPELTGNGNAELWGWFPDANSPRVEQINKMNGAPVKTYPLATLKGTPMAWAFAFWGGDYWIFLERSNETMTTVYQVKGDTVVITTMTGAPGREIVGAGVSTCAPVVIL